MKSSYEHEITAFVGEIWSTMLGVVTHADDQAIVVTDKRNTLTGRVCITGAWQGILTLHCDPKLACYLAAIMFDVDPHLISSDQVEDALAELANMASGNLKSLLPEPCFLSLPQAGNERAFGLEPAPRDAIDCFGFRCHGLPFALSVCAQPVPLAQESAS
jgi:CheY-specific phosphatase CheX